MNPGDTDMLPDQVSSEQMEETKLYLKEERRSLALSYLINNLFEANNLDECLDTAIEGLSMLDFPQIHIGLLEDGYFTVKRNYVDKKFRLIHEKITDHGFIGQRIDPETPFISQLLNSRIITTTHLEDAVKVELEELIWEYLPKEMDPEKRLKRVKEVVSHVPKEMKLIMMPINHRGKAVGVIGISSTTIERDDILYMQNLCELLAQSFEKGRINEALRRMNEEQERCEARFRDLADSLPQTVFELDERGNLTFSNRKGFEVTGYTQEELEEGIDALQLFVPEDRDRVKENIQRILSGEELGGNEYTALRRDGSTLPVMIYSTPIIRGDKPIGLRGIVIDITERKRMEKELRRYSEYLENVYAASPHAITATDLNGYMIECNQATIELHGYSSKEELIGKSAFILIAQRDHERATENMKKTLEQGSIKNIEYAFLTKDGREFPAELSASVVEDSSGTPTGFMAITKDITQRKEMEEELRENEEKFRNLAEQSPNMIFINKSGKIVYANQRCEEVTGYKREEFYSPDFDLLRLISPESLERVKESFKRHTRGEEVPPLEYTLVTKDGGKIEVILTTKLIRYGGEMAILGTVTDITERKRMEEELKRYSGLLEDVVWEKSKQLKEAERMAAIGETAAMVGHDLRNPLQVLTNMVYLAKKTLYLAPSSVRSFVEVNGLEEMLEEMREQVDYMDKIASDLRDYARPIEPKTVPTTLYHLVKDTLSTIAFPETVEVSIVISEDMPKLMVDPFLMKRVLANLITNALQAMPQGGLLTIRTSQTEDSALISIEDTGVGIPEENLDEIFHPLFTTKSKGQGFGLAVSKRMVEAHGGEISVESEVDRGTTFTVEIPLRRR